MDVIIRRSSPKLVIFMNSAETQKAGGRSIFLERAMPVAFGPFHVEETEQSLYVKMVPCGDGVVAPRVENQSAFRVWRESLLPRSLAACMSASR